MWTLTTALFQTMDNKDAAKATIAMIFIFYFFYDIAYTPMLVAYTLEILPFNVRAKGFAVMVSFYSRESVCLSTHLRSVYTEYYCVPHARVQPVRESLGFRRDQLEIRKCLAIILTLTPPGSPAEVSRITLCPTTVSPH